MSLLSGALARLDVMRPSRILFWATIFTPLGLFLAFLSAGAGHGDYSLAILFYPYTMLSVLEFEEITPPFLVFALVQFVIYAFLLIAASRHRRRALGLISMVHLVAVILALVFVPWGPLYYWEIVGRGESTTIEIQLPTKEQFHEPV